MSGVESPVPFAAPLRNAGRSAVRRPLNKAHDQNLNDDDPQEHAYGIDRRVRHGRMIAGDRVVGIVQRHRVGHAAAHDAGYLSEIEFEEPQRQGGYDNDGDEREEESQSDPEHSFGAHDRFDEMGARFEPQAGQIERQSQCPEHQVGAQRGVGDDVDAGAEGPDQDAEDDRAACESQFDGEADTRYRERDASQQQAQEQTDENRNQVGFVELFDGIAEDFFDAFDRLRFTHYRQAVAQLQREIGRGEQLYARTMHPADVDAVQVSQTQRAEFAAVDFGAGDDDRPGDELAVQCVPVDVVRIPVFLYPLAEEEFQCLHVVRRGDYQYQITRFEGRVRSRNRNLPGTPKAGDDEMVVAVCRDVADAFADDAGVGNLEFDDEDILFMFGVRLRNVRGPGEEFAYGDDAQNHAYDTQRVGQCTAQRGVVAVQLHLREHLLCRTERRGVGRGAAQDACHVAHGNTGRIAEPYGQCRTCQDDERGERNQPDAARAERTEETGADLQSQCIDEEYEPETFGESQHRRIDRESEMARCDADEENERHAERNSEKTHFAQHHAEHRDQREHDDGLNGRMLGKKIRKPVHFVSFRDCSGCKNSCFFRMEMCGCLFLPDRRNERAEYPYCQGRAYPSDHFRGEGVWRLVGKRSLRIFGVGRPASSRSVSPLARRMVRMRSSLKKLINIDYQLLNTRIKKFTQTNYAV